MFNYRIASESTKIYTIKADKLKNLLSDDKVHKVQLEVIVNKKIRNVILRLIKLRNIFMKEIQTNYISENVIYKKPLETDNNLLIKSVQCKINTSLLNYERFNSINKGRRVSNIQDNVTYNITNTFNNTSNLHNNNNNNNNNNNSSILNTSNNNSKSKISDNYYANLRYNKGLTKHNLISLNKKRKNYSVDMSLVNITTNNTNSINTNNNNGTNTNNKNSSNTLNMNSNKNIYSLNVVNTSHNANITTADEDGKFLGSILHTTDNNKFKYEDRQIKDIKRCLHEIEEYSFSKIKDNSRNLKI